MIPPDLPMMVLTQAVTFLFDEARKTLTERRERRRKAGETDDTVSLPSGTKGNTKEEVLALKPVNFNTELEKEIENAKQIIKIHMKHRRDAELIIAQQGGDPYVSPNVRFERDYAEDEIQKYTQRLKKLLEEVYSRPIHIDGLG